MTDEEKAEEYSDNLDLVKERNPELKTNDDFIKQAYLDGLSEGRKEKECNCMTYLSFKTLEKENEELKAQIEQLSNDNHVLKTSFIIQQKQIEKMECCPNCKHRTLYINGGKVMCYKDVVHEFGKPRQKCNQWELAE